MQKAVFPARFPLTSRNEPRDMLWFLKWDQRCGYASKPRILLRCSSAIKQGNKPVTGQFMVQTRGRELRQITALKLGKKVGVIAEVERGPLTFSGNGC